MRVKLDPAQIKDLESDLQHIFKAHGDVIRDEPRIEKPLKEALQATTNKYERVADKP